MSFVNSAFFWAMFAVSVPIVIHLINFRRHKTLYFSNTSFLEDLKKQTRTRTRLKQILILIARIITIAMLVIAFAGPFIPNKTGLDQNKSEINIIYIDNSFSMEAEGLKGQVFEQAKQIAKQITFNSDAGMDYILITNDMLPQHQFVIDRDKLLQELDKTDISSSTLKFDDVILKANTLLPEGEMANLYILSDMQEGFIGKPTIKPSENIRIMLIPMEASTVNNLYVDSCWFETPVHRKGQEEELIARIVNFSEEDFVDIPVQLFINDSLKALSSLNIEAGQTEDVKIDYVNSEAGYFNARIEISDYPVTYDNVLYFNYMADLKTDVLLINGQGSDKYLRSVYQSDPDNFVLKEVKLGSEQSAEFGNYDVILLNNVSDISSGLASELLSFVAGGGSVVLIPSAEMDYSSINNFLVGFNVGRFDNTKFSGKKLSSIDYDHTIFRDVFVNRDNQTGLPIAGLVHKYVLFNNSSFSGLMLLENGSPVLVDGNYKKGKLYVFTAPVGQVNSDLVKSPVFVPTFYNIAINSQLSSSLYAVIGRGATVNISYPSEIAASDIFRIVGNNNVDAIADFNAAGKNLKIFIPEAMQIAGNYELLKGESFVSPISVNYNRLESVLEYTDNEELNKFVEVDLGADVEIFDANSDDITMDLREFSEGKPLWQLFLILAFFFILCEVALARLMKK